MIQRNDDVRLPALILLSILLTEKEADKLLNETVLTDLIDFFGKSVRHELPKNGTLWTLRRRTLVMRTLEWMIISDEHFVPTLLKLNLLPLIEKVLFAPNTT